MGKPISEFQQQKYEGGYATLKLGDGEPATLVEDKSGCWYVLSILSTIFCCLPCGVIGLVHAMIARHEGERGNNYGYRRRLRQAKCWTIWSIVLGLLVIILMIVYLVWLMKLLTMIRESQAAATGQQIRPLHY